MKEKIYTIPLNEAYEKDSECPFCFIKKKLEEESVDYALGAAMMEPDHRIISNEKGYCRRHCEMMLNKPNKLSLALVLDSHYSELQKRLSSMEKDINLLGTKKGGLFKKRSSAEISKITEILDKTERSCVICDKITNTSKRYIEVFFYLWKNDPSFRRKVEGSKGVCLPHLKILFDAAFLYLSYNDAAGFVRFLYEKEKNELMRIGEDIHKFTLKFDYRNKDMELGDAADAPLRSVEKIAGFMLSGENDDK